MTHKRQEGFTLLELLVSMALMSVITYACVWVFQQSMDLYSKSVGRGEINQNLRVAEEKLHKDLLSCLPLKSGAQEFTMISRFGRDGYLNKAYPRDYLSFATMTRVDGSLTQAYVHYDIVNTESGMPVLMRYVQTLDNFQSEGIDGVGAVFVREVVAQYCTMFQIEYLWKDPRSVGASFPSTSAHEKQVPDPGVFMFLHPEMNQDNPNTPYDHLVRYKTGGLNGSNIVEHSAGVVHAGATASSVSEEYLQAPFMMGADLKIPNRGVTNAESGLGAPSMNVKNGTSDGNVVSVSSLSGITTNPYTRMIRIRSPNLFGSSNTLAASQEPFDITADYSAAGAWGTDMSAVWTAYETANPTRWPTYVPSMLRITMKVYSADRKLVNTRSFVLTVPTSGR